MKKLVVEKRTDLKTFVSEKLKITKKQAKRLIDKKNVFVNNKRVWISSHTLNPKDIVEINFDYSFKKEISKSDVLYEDEYLLAVQKPPFIESNGKKNSVETQLREIFNNKKIVAVHRLDRETSGVLLFAKDFKTFEKLKHLWTERNIKKVYLSINYGNPNFKFKVIDYPVEKKFAKSIFKLLKKRENFNLFEIEIKTGRKHQIRIHSKKLNIPIVGDKLYGLKEINDPVLKIPKRQMLHSYKLSFFHPYLKKKILITAPLFTDFENFGKLVKLL